MNQAQKPAQGTRQSQKDAEEDHFFLPDFCSVRMVFAIIIIAELLAIVLALAPMGRVNLRWEDLSIISLFVQWVALISAAVLCVARRWLKLLSDTLAATASYLLLLTTTTVVSEVTFLTALRFNASQELSVEWHTDFLLSNLGISTIVSAVVLRYFYVQFQWGRNLQAKSEARIQALQSRIRPHFLFNSLNTIASLARTQPDVAEEATEDLADLFRGSLADSSYEARLKDEWELARRYCHIEKLRLRERLQIEWAIDSLPDDALIPQLTIQPLLENAVYHGIEQLPNGGTINITGRFEDDLITITITNPMPENIRDKQRSGNKMAQENVSLRLAALYGNKGKLIADQKGTQYRLTIILPYIRER